MKRVSNVETRGLLIKVAGIHCCPSRLEPPQPQQQTHLVVIHETIPNPQQGNDGQVDLANHAPFHLLVPRLSIFRHHRRSNVLVACNTQRQRLRLDRACELHSNLPGLPILANDPDPQDLLGGDFGSVSTSRTTLVDPLYTLLNGSSGRGGRIRVRRIYDSPGIETTFR